MNKHMVGVDIGGTNISTGLIENGKAVKLGEIPTQAYESKETIINNLFTAIDQVFTNKTQSIGIGVPGMVDSNNGIIYDLANIPAWKEVHIKELVEEQFKVPVRVNNDANCFVLGVKHFGIGKDYSNIVGITLGTGLGSGIIINNKLYTGLQSGAGEYGQIPYRESILENYCSGKFFRCVKNVNGKEIFQKAGAGDKDALGIWEEYGYHLGNLINILLATLAPELIVFGGSVAQGFPFFIGAIESEISNYVLPKVAEEVKIDYVINSNSAILGAGALGI